MTAEVQQLHPERPTLDHADIRWRVSNTWDKGAAKMGMLVGYIDARTCMEALDELDPNWSAEHGEPIIVGGELAGVACRLSVNGVTRSDVGMPSSQEPIKGAYSDALKRAAVHFGIGRELYELPKIAVECQVDSRGKVKAPKALPVYRDGRWEIDRKYGWVKYDRDPDEQPVGASARRRPPGIEDGELRDAISAAAAEHGLSHDKLSAIANELGIPKGQNANTEQLRAILARIEQPQEQEGMPAAEPGEAGHAAPGSLEQPQADERGHGRQSQAVDVPNPATTPLGVEPSVVPDSSGAAADRAQPGFPRSSAAPDSDTPAPSMEDVLAITGGEEIPPTPGSDPFKALDSKGRAAARAYWSQQEKGSKRPDAEELRMALEGEQS